MLTTKYLILYGKTWKRLLESPEYAEMRHGDVILTLKLELFFYEIGLPPRPGWRHNDVMSQRFIFTFPRAGTGMGNLTIACSLYGSKANGQKE